MTEREERCDRCRWWQPGTQVGPEGEQIGDCRRHPPKMVVDPEQVFSRWPWSAEYDWCGEYRPRDPRGFPA
jgi:hypothetical protein